MNGTPELYWLPAFPDWRVRFKALSNAAAPSWDEALALARAKLDFVRTNQLDQLIQRTFTATTCGGSKLVRLAILGSSTFAHLHAAIRIAAIRRGIWVDIYENDYGQYLQELADPQSELHAFFPNAVLFAFDPWHLSGSVNAAMSQADTDAALEETWSRIEGCWSIARSAFGCTILQQTVLASAILPSLGQNEHRLPGSRRGFVSRLNNALIDRADHAGVHLVGLQERVEMDGLGGWHDSVIWHRAKQEVSPAAAPVYGELVARLLAAEQGRSAKCLVLDLDNTLWGGVIGDDGLDGIVVGQGSALGEAFLSVQDYAKELSRRGIVLAVCSKNDLDRAIEPFDKHPDMILRRSDIASFIANWGDKADNIRTIAAELNLGLDAIVFLDDNPFERNLVRQELPMVSVPEVSDDPAAMARCLADAGYFETLRITDEDRERTSQYQNNRAREALKVSATDMDSYLRGLDMVLLWRRFDRIGLQRIVQLINKTNQFNLTTQRYTETDIESLMADPRSFGLQLRLTDRFGDNGIIAIIIGRMSGKADLVIDTWLMSCRVLGRQVEQATLNLVVEQSRLLGAQRVIGIYRPTKKNGMVKDHYIRLGFTQINEDADGVSTNVLDLDAVNSPSTFISIKEG